MYNNQLYGVSGPLYGVNALNTLSIDEIIIYLRKSRQDDPNETVEEVLARHETDLQNYALRVWGAKIPEANIYREVVSGETIEDRPEIKKVIDRMQGGKVAAVLVIEVSRLSRGDMLDLGIIEHSFLYTSTLCITPDRFFDLNDKYMRRAFEDELRSSNRYLEQTKETLMRGRRLSASQGYWVQATAPYGYDREQQRNKRFILVANENAANVRMAFEWFADGWGFYKIAKTLTNTNVAPSMKKTIKWSIQAVRRMLQNDAYIGIVRFGCTKTIRVYENGVLKKKQVPAPESEHIVVRGKHDPIIPLDLWDRVQQRLGTCDKTNSQYDLVNPLASLLFCKKCGRALIRKGGGTGGKMRFACASAPQCPVKSVIIEVLYDTFHDALRAQAFEIEEKIRTGAGSIREAREVQLAQLEVKMQKLVEQEDHQYDLLEKKEYTPEVFNRRHSKLVKEMDELRAAIEEARKTMPETVDYDDALVRLNAAIDAFDNPDMTPLEKNMILKAIVARVDYDRERTGKQHNPFELDIHLKL